MIKIIIFLLVTMALIPVVYAEEFDVNGYTILTNSTDISEIQLNWGNGILPSGSITFDKIIADTIHIQIPKDMPRTTNLDFGVGLYAIQSPHHAELLITETESDCFYNLSIPVRNSDKIKISSVSAAAGRTVTQVVNDCKDIEIIGLSLKTQLENHLHVKEIECQNNNHVLIERTNKKIACVYPSTAEELGWKIANTDSALTPSIFEVVKDDTIFDIEYKIQGGSVEDMVYDEDTNSLLVKITPTSEGEISLDVPIDENGLFKDFCEGNNMYPDSEHFFILRDIEEIDYESFEINTDLKNVELNYLSDTKLIEIIYACLI